MTRSYNDEHKIVGHTRHIGVILVDVNVVFPQIPPEEKLLDRGIRRKEGFRSSFVNDISLHLIHCRAVIASLSMVAKSWCFCIAAA